MNFSSVTIFEMDLSNASFEWDEGIRMISARLATREEKEIYEYGKDESE